MAGLRGNVAWWIINKQTVKGTPAAVTAAGGAIKMPFAGGSIAPVRETDRLSETDSSRLQGSAYVTTSGVEGSPETYVRDGSTAVLLNAVLGSTATTGTGPNYTHTITPGSVLPFYTIWRDVGDTLYERFLDCKISSVNISAEAGSPLTNTVGVQGRQATRLTTAPDVALPIAIENSAVYNFNDAAVTLGGGATALVRSFDMTIENNISRQQTDDVVPYDVVEGQLEVSLGFDLIFEALDEYNKFHYGGAAGTAISPDIFTTSAVFTFTKGANNEISFNFPSIAYEEFPVDPQPGGDPLVVSVRAVSQRSGSPAITATVKTQIATL
jgi:hypothetical protein